MKHYFLEGWNMVDVYHHSLVCLMNELEKGHVDQNGFVDCKMTMSIASPLSEPRISRMFPGTPYSLEQYRQEILDGILDFEVKAGNWHYTYHQRYAKWIDGCVIPELRRDPGSRRAVTSIRDNEADALAENPACLQSMQFMIRDGKLDMDVLFRSNDAVRAAFMNMFALIELQKKVAGELNVPVGTYTHAANSYHCYPDSVFTLIGYYNRIVEAAETKRYEDTWYNYAGEWDKLMEAEKPAIEKQVNELKKKEGLI